MSDLHTSHKAFLIAETQTVTQGIKDALAHMGALEWLEKSDYQNVSSAEFLTEFMGRGCYKSFVVGLNPNVTKIREGNDVYLGNILKQKHGSVMEHATTTFWLCDVSRIFTHELVRHRAGTAFSQESQRFVRLENFQLYIPDLTDALIELVPHSPTADGDTFTEEEWVQNTQDQFVQMANRITSFAEAEMKDFIKAIGLDADGISFHVKKQITSAMRRLIPGGVNTNIGITSNHRNWRHLIQSRTSPGAEVEMIGVFNDIAKQLRARYFNLYQDMFEDIITHEITFSNVKV